MKKKVLSIFMAMLVAVSTSACSSVQSSEISSSSALTPLVGSSMVEALTPSPEPTADTAEEEALISEIMKNELGETAPITVTSVEEPRAIEGTDSYLCYVDFTAGDRELTANFITVDGVFEVHSISSSEDPGHFYYFPSLATSSSLTGISFQLYDYDTDEPLPPPDVEISSDEVTEIISQIPEISVSPDTVGGPMLYLDVNVESAPTEDIATSFYGSSLQFLVEYIQLDPIPYSTVTFNIMLDGTIRLGYMQMVAFPELGILGTEPPVMEIEEETTVGIFEEKYDEYMYAIDADNIQSGMYS